jgi:hypothetical protein
MSDERYIVAESSGYLTASSRAWVTEVMVQDRAYCHRVVWSSLSSPTKQEHRYWRIGRNGRESQWERRVKTNTARRWSLAKRRAYARDLAAQWNAEDEAA